MVNFCLILPFSPSIGLIKFTLKGQCPLRAFLKLRSVCTSESTEPWESQVHQLDLWSVHWLWPVVISSWIFFFFFHFLKEEWKCPKSFAVTLPSYWLPTHTACVRFEIYLYLLTRTQNPQSKTVQFTNSDFWFLNLKASRFILKQNILKHLATFKTP